MPISTGLKGDHEMAEEETAGTTQTSQVEQESQKQAAPTPPAEENQRAERDTDGKRDTLPDDPDQLKREIHKLRQENAKDRTTAKQNAAAQAQDELIRKLGQALGLIKDEDEQLTAEQLTAQLTSEQEKRANAQREFAVYKAAQGVADPDMLTDSRAFAKTISDIDPDDATAIRTAIEQFVKDHPQYAAQRASVSGIEHPAGSGETEITVDQFKAMSGTQRNELFHKDPEQYRALAKSL